MPIIPSAILRVSRPLQSRLHSCCVKSRSKINEHIVSKKRVKMAQILEEQVDSSDSNSDCEPPAVYHYYSHAQELQIPAKFPRYNWVLLSKYDTLELALDYIRKEDTWDEDHTYDWADDKMYFKCTQGNCPCKRYVLVEYETTLVSMYRTETQHDHKNRRGSKDFDKRVLKEIKKCLKMDMLEPSVIVSALSEVENIVTPSEDEVVDYISYINKKKIKRQCFNPEDLRMFLIRYSRIPDDIHEPFVIDYELNPLGLPLFFRMVLSTKYLLNFAASANIIHASAHYRLTWQGFPVVVVGTSDRDKQFHPICLFVTSNEYETKEDYKLIFGCLRQKIPYYFGKRFNPKFLVNDASDSIQRAFQETFTSGKIRICWGFARKVIKSHAKLVVDKQTQKEMFADLEMLHTITRKGAFNAGMYFFMKKYQEYTDFIDYLNEEWILKNRNWYLGAVPGTPPTNSTFNQYIRELRAKKVINDDQNLVNFLLTSSKLVNEWSTRYSRDKNFEFVTETTIDLALWANSFCWSRHPKELVMVRQNERYLYYQVPVGDRNSCKRFTYPPTNLKEFKNQYMSNWHVVMPVIKSHWQYGKCNCPKFFKNYMCPHVVGMALRLKLATVPAKAKALAYKERPQRMKAYMLKLRDAVESD